MMLKSVIDAIPKSCILMNAPKESLNDILEILPSSNPTVSQLAKGDWVDIMVILEKRVLREILPKLKEAGAKSIAELPVNKIIE